MCSRQLQRRLSSVTSTWPLKHSIGLHDEAGSILFICSRETYLAADISFFRVINLNLQLYIYSINEAEMRYNLHKKITDIEEEEYLETSKTGLNSHEQENINLLFESSFYNQIH